MIPTTKMNINVNFDWAIKFAGNDYAHNNIIQM